MEKKEKICPKYYANQLIVGNGRVAIVTGWTKKEKIYEQLSEKAKENVALMGQLYSKEGINYIIRNIFLNPAINYILITGKDLSQSLAEFKGFLKGENKEYIHEELSKDKVNEFVSYFGKHFLCVEENDLNSALINSEITNLRNNWTQKTIDFPRHISKSGNAKTFPSEKVGFRLEGATVSAVWLKVLDRISKFGFEKMSAYGEKQRELVNIITVINNDDPDSPNLAPCLNFNKTDLENYYPQMMTACTFEGIEYTYGNRLRNHEGINQIDAIIEELKNENFSRRAIAFTWDVKKDCQNEKAPCLDLVQALVQGDTLYLTAYFRSNDMYRAWPINAYGLLKIQKDIAYKLNLKVGKITIISSSAHIYERDFVEAQKTIEKYKPKLECEIDPRGNFVIEVFDKEIIVKHYDGDGLFLQEFKGKNAQEIRQQIFSFITDISHAIYLGSELYKAEYAIKNNKNYVQDED